MEQLSAALGHTPWWVYVLLVILVKRGVAARQPAVHGFGRLLILPLLFTLWGIWEMATVLHPGALLLLGWALGLGAGAAIGWLLLRGIRLRADHKRWLIARPGDRTLLPIALLSFAVKYAFAYALGSEPSLAGNAAFVAGDLAASGIISGIFIGKLAVYWAAFRQAPSEPLSLSPAT